MHSNPQLFHASSLGISAYIAQAPNAEAASVGCGLIFSGLNGSVQVLGYTDTPVVVRPEENPAEPSLLQINTDGSTEYVTVTESITTSVKYTPQTLTNGQKVQARVNIGAAPAVVAQSGWYTPTNYSANRTLDADTATLEDLIDITATLIVALRGSQIFEGDPGESSGQLDPQTGWSTPTSVTPNRTLDANDVTLQELADILGTVIVDLIATGALQP